MPLLLANESLDWDVATDKGEYPWDMDANMGFRLAYGLTYP